VQVAGADLDRFRRRADKLGASSLNSTYEHVEAFTHGLSVVTSDALRLDIFTVGLRKGWGVGAGHA